MTAVSKKSLIFLLPLMLLMAALSSFECSARISTTVVPDDAVQFGDHYYKVYNDLTGFDDASWDMAKSFCEKRGGHLAVITSAEEDEFLSSYCSEHGHSDVFFGLYYKNGSWKWVTGEKFGYSDWGKGKPGGKKEGSCGQYSAVVSRGNWNNGDFGYDGRAYICEWDSGTHIEEADISDAETSIDKGRSRRSGQSYYRVFNIPLERNEAARYCGEMGGHLVSIGDTEEQKFINELIKKKGSSNMYWIGASLGDNGWTWQDGSSLDGYNYWTSKKPNNAGEDIIFAAINGSLKKFDKNHWVAEKKNGSASDSAEYCVNFGFICEWDIVCVSDEGESISHDGGEWQMGSKSSCTSPGKRMKYCKRCGQLAAEEQLEPRPHLYVHKGLSLPGFTGLYCTRCGKHSVKIDKKKVWILPLILVIYCLFAAAYRRARTDFEMEYQKKGREVLTKRIPMWVFAIPPGILALLALTVELLAR